MHYRNHIYSKDTILTGFIVNNVLVDLPNSELIQIYTCVTQKKTYFIIDHTFHVNLYWGNS